MTNAERMIQLDNEPDQRALRTARGLRALAATLLVAGLVAAIVTELPLGRSTVAGVPASEEIANPAPAPAAEPRVAPSSVIGSPEEFLDRTPTPPSVIVG